MAIPMLILPKEIREKVLNKGLNQRPEAGFEPDTFQISQNPVLSALSWSDHLQKEDIRLQLSISAEEQHHCQAVPVKFRTLSTKTNWSIGNKSVRVATGAARVTSYIYCTSSNRYVHLFTISTIIYTNVHCTEN